MRRSAISLALVVLALASAAAFAAQQQAADAGKKRAVAEAITGGNAGEGFALYDTFGCGACHSIGGRGLPQGRVGPDLTGFSRRAYIAGRLSNQPENLIRWIADPFTVDPQTAMPDLGVSTDQARNLAAYLYANT